MLIKKVYRAKSQKSQSCFNSVCRLLKSAIKVMRSQVIWGGVMVKAFYSFRDTLPEVACYGKHNTGCWRVFCTIQQVNKPLIKTEGWEFNIHLMMRSKCYDNAMICLHYWMTRKNLSFLSRGLWLSGIWLLLADFLISGVHTGCSFRNADCNHMLQLRLDYQPLFGCNVNSGVSQCNKTPNIFVWINRKLHVHQLQLLAWH